MQVLEQQQTKLNEKKLKSLMLGVYEKVENQEIQTDRQIIDEVMERMRPYTNTLIEEIRMEGER